MKVLFACLVSLAFGAVLLFRPALGGDWPEGCGNNKSHNFNFGRTSLYDRILYVNHTFAPSKFLQKHSFDVTIPPKGQRPIGIISSVQVMDQYTNGKGGCAYLKSGGPGYANVTLHLKSLRGEGINFIINVYGHY